MPNTLRWILVAPATLVATVGAYIILTLVWNLVRAINIVPQDGFIDLGLANLSINGLAAVAGVFVGARTAPCYRQITAIVMAALLVLLAVVTIALGSAFRANLSMSFGWHVFSSIAWIAGAGIAAYIVSKKSSH